MKIYYIDTFNHKAVVTVEKPEQIFAKNVPDFHSGGEKYLICFRDGDRESRLAWFESEAERDYELKKHQGYVTSTVGIVGDLTLWPANERP